jgi:H-type lectin domain/Astacin (Peptidase family M12A)
MAADAVDYSKLHFCTQILAEPDALPDGNFKLPDGDSGPSSLAMPISTFWPNGTRLRVRLDGGSAFVRKKVQQFATEWENFANVDFRFVAAGQAAEIRVTFTPGGSWSFIGRSNLNVPSTNPTMNFGWFNDSTPDLEFSRTVIHEFGHALGAVHEHQSPAANIPWDKPAVYAYYAATQTPPWTKEQVDRNIFDKYSASTTRFTAFDKFSIMCYHIPNELTIGDYEIGWNRVLSDTDKSYIKQMYPPQARDTGTYITLEQRPWFPPVASNVKQVSFWPPHEVPPNVAVGLTYLDISKDANIRINAYADRITTASMSVHLDAWADTPLYSAGCTWLEDRQDEFQIQVGDFSTKELHPWYEPTKTNSKWISFPRAFSSPPKVIVWLKSVDMAKNFNWRVETYPSYDVSTTGFTININTWADSILYSADASWIAYLPISDKVPIYSGSGDTKQYRNWSPPQLTNGAKVDFPAGTFDKLPKTLLLAVNRFDFDYRHNLRFKVFANTVSEAGFRWHVDSWADSLCYGAGISYIAFG